LAQQKRFKEKLKRLRQGETRKTEKREPAAIGHVRIEVTNLTKSKQFFRTMLAGLGFQIVMDTQNAAGFSKNLSGLAG
jgi:catechol-2,3-dioxygenase